MEVDPRDKLIAELRAENAQLRARVAELEAQVKTLLAQVEALGRMAHRQAAPFRRPEKKRKPKGKGPGRPGGHPGAFRVQPEQVDEQIEVPLVGCPVCGGALTDIEATEQFIEDLPVTRPHVTHLTTHSGWCGRCGTRVQSSHPRQVSRACGSAGTHLGSRALLLAAMLNKGIGLPMRKTCRILQTLGGLRITAGGLSQAVDRVADRLQSESDQLLADLRSEPVVYADETSWWVGGRRSWLWTFTSPRATLYRVRESRGGDVVLQTLGEDFGGTLVSDCLASYEKLPYRMHKCYAHHLKAIASAMEASPQSEYLCELRGLLKGAIVLRLMHGQMPADEWITYRRNLEQSADRLLGEPRGDPAEEQVANRLRTRRRWLFTCVDHPAVEPTNNRAERALRPAVIGRKLSCGNKTPRGVRTWEILTSLTATCGDRFLDLAQPRLAIAAR